MNILFKHIVLSYIFICIISDKLHADHLTGGTMSYEYVSSLSDGRQVYNISVQIFRDAISSNTNFDNPINITIWNMDNNTNRRKKINRLNSNISNVTPNNLGPCAKQVPTVDIRKVIYTFLDTVGLNNNGYVYAHQRCCRTSTINNLTDPQNQGSTYTVHLTRRAMLANNSTPVYNQEPPLLICVKSNFKYQFAASDKNGHKLRYYLCAPKLGGGPNAYNSHPDPTSKPPFSDVVYSNSNNALQPLGSNVDVDIDPNTGLLTMRPDRLGVFTVGVCVEEFDQNNQSLGFTSRDLQFTISNCIVASAVALIDAAIPVEGLFSTCKGLGVQFKNQSLDAQTYFWDFGVGGIASDTSTLKEPIFAFPDSGRYDVTLIINRGQTCADTARISLNVYPTLVPDFDFQVFCEGVPVKFISNSTSTVDPIVKETWYYNNQIIGTGKNIDFQFSDTGPYTIKLLVETLNGCQDSITKNFTLPTFTKSDFTITGIRQGQSDTFVVCNNTRSVTFNNLMPVSMARAWSLGNQINTEHSPVYIFPDTGIYKIQLIASPNTPCADTSFKWVRVLPNPVADFTFISQCHQFPVEFTTNRNRPFDQINTVSWNFGDGTTSTDFNPKKDYTDVKNYNVRLTVTSVAGCTATNTQSVTVYPEPVADFDILGEKQNQNFLLCDAWLPIVFEPKSINAQTYYWDFGPGLGTTHSFTSMFVFPDTGTYNVQLIINRGQRCTDTIVKQLRLIDGIAKTDFVVKDVCVNIAQTFTNQSVAVKNDFTSYLWDFGDNTTSNAKNPAKSFAQPGTYTIKLIVTTALGCKDSIEKKVVIYPAPVVDFVNDDACLNTSQPFNNISTISNGTIDSYLWTFGNLGTATDVHSSFVFSTAGNYNITLNATSNHGCVSKLTKSVRVRPSSIANFEFTNHCVKAPVFFKDISTSPYNDIAQWIWTFEGGQIKTGKEVNYTYSTPGKHTVKLVIVTSYGCRDSIIKDITIGDVPKAAFNISGNTANSQVLYNCNADYTVKFTNTSIGQLNYSWSFGLSGQSSQDKDPQFLYPDTGTYMVRLTTEPGTVCQNFIEKSIRVLPPVVASYTFSNECVKAPVYFNANTDRIFDPIKTIAWNFGDASTSNIKEPIKLYANSGSYNVRLTLTAESGCDAVSLQKINIAPAPVANYVPEGITAANGDFIKCEELLAVRFKNTSTGSDDDLWTFNDLNKTSTIHSPTNVFSQTGEFPVTLYINRGNICSDSITKNIKVVQGIEWVDFDFANACANTDIQFTDKSKAVLNNITEYLWDFGDNTSSVLKNPKKQYASAGDYIIKLYVKTANGCIDSLEKKITIYPIPGSLFDVTTACLNVSVHIDNKSGISSGQIVKYFWQFGNQQTSNDIAPDIVYTSPGFYPVSLTTTSDFGCLDTLEDIIEIKIPSKPDFSYINQCFSAPVEFKDLTVSAYNDIQKWEWTMQPNVVLTNKDPSYKFPNDGAFDVQLMVTTILGCKDSLSKSIVLKPHPIADFTVDGTELSEGVFVKCDDTRTIYLKNESVDNQTNIWKFDNYATSLDVSPTFVFPDTGSFFVSLRINDGTLCADTKQVKLDVLPGLFVDFSYSLACEKNEMEFTDLSVSTLKDIVRRDWNTGDQYEYQGMNVQHTYAKFGNYPVQFVVQTARGCLDTLKKDVKVFALPDIVVDLPEICPKQNTRLPNATKAVNNNAIQSYFWNLDNGVTSIDKFPYVTYDIPGTYEIQLKVLTQAGCGDSIKDIILVRDLIEPSLVQSRSIFCEQQYILFDASNSKGIFQDYFWEFGDGQTSSQSIDSVAYHDGGDYTIRLTLKDELCGEFTATSKIEIVSIPEISLGNDFALCPNLTTDIHLTTSGALDSIKWSTGVKDLPVVVVDGNVGTVIAEVFVKGCYNVDSVVVTPSCDVVAPKAFSPNRDKTNDYFNVLPPNVQTYQLFVYNRWGHEVFTTNDLKKGWDGQYKGEDLPMDNYTYYAVGVKTDGSHFTIQGSVLLIR